MKSQGKRFAWSFFLLVAGLLLLGKEQVCAASLHDEFQQMKLEAIGASSSQKSTKKKNGWNEDKTSYYVNGRAVTGAYVINNKMFLFNNKGIAYRYVGLKYINGHIYYFKKDYSIHRGIMRLNGKYFYFLFQNGQFYKGNGIQKVEGYFHYFNSDGSLRLGWYRNPDNNQRYYFTPTFFSLAIGWQYIDGYKYYFARDGHLMQDIRFATNNSHRSYLIRVNRAASCVTVYTTDGSNGYTIPVVSFVCSAGNATPIGTFHTKAKLRWHELMGPCWGQWCTKITDSILFHSVYYDRKNDNRSLNVAAYNKLGTICSHGCVRLTAGDAKWIYDYCDTGTTVEIYDDASNPGPFDKPTAQKLSPSHTWDPTDPAFQ